MRAAVASLAYLLASALALAAPQDKSAATAPGTPSIAPTKPSDPDASAGQLAAIAQSVSNSVNSDLDSASKKVPPPKCNKKSLIVRKNWYVFNVIASRATVLPHRSWSQGFLLSYCLRPTGSSGAAYSKIAI